MPDDARRSRRGGVDTSVRTALIWQRVRELVEADQRRLGRPLRVLDLGGGTGGLAVPLVELGQDVTVVDPSPDALAALDRRIADADLDAGAARRVHAYQGDTTTLRDLTHDGFDLICCHGVLEVVDDPHAAVGDLAAALAPGGAASIVVAQRLATVLARALAGKFAQAGHALSDPDGRWGEVDPLPRRFDADAVETLLTNCGLTVLAAHGVRLFSDLVPAAYLDTEPDRLALLDLERAIAGHPDASILGRLAGGWHVLARRPAN